MFSFTYIKQGFWKIFEAINYFLNKKIGSCERKFNFIFVKLNSIFNSIYIKINLIIKKFNEKIFLNFIEDFCKIFNNFNKNLFEMNVFKIKCNVTFDFKKRKQNFKESYFIKKKQNCYENENYNRERNFESRKNLKFILNQNHMFSLSIHQI